MGFVDVVLNNLTMYRLMLYFLSILVGVGVLLSAFGVLPYSAWDIFLQAIVFVVICWGSNTFLSRVLRTKPNFESSIITALILTLVIGPVSLPGEWVVVVVTSLAAMVSKYLFVQRKSHIFNPAAIGMFVSMIVLGYPATWWVGSELMLPTVFAGGVLVVRKTRRFHLVVSFLGVYVGLLVLDILLARGGGFSQLGNLVQNLVLFSPIFFFSFVMLIEPLTAPQTHGRRLYFGSFVGAVLFTFQRFVPAIPFSLETALLFGNVFARIVNPDFRQSFVLQRKESVASSISSFWFEPTRPFLFQAGQFLEYTLGHAHADSRGMRRYFTIASSPTEKQILVCSRFSEKGSTFKKALSAMKPGDEIIASKIAGDFVLPKDPTSKLAFIAGGIGITPFRSIVKHLLDKNQSRDIVLLYGAKSEEELVFRDIFEEAHERFGMKDVYVTKGFIDGRIIEQEVPDFKERTFYVSGPEPMVKAVEKMLAGMGVPRKHIKRDYFPGYEA